MNEYTLDVSSQVLVYIKAELHLRMSSNFPDYLPTKPSKTCTWCCNVIGRLARGTCTQSYCFSTMLLGDQYWLSWSYKCSDLGRGYHAVCHCCYYNASILASICSIWPSRCKKVNLTTVCQHRSTTDTSRSTYAGILRNEYTGSRKLTIWTFFKEI